MSMIKFFAAAALLVFFGAAHACPGDSSSQTKSPTVEKPLAPKPAV